MPLDDLPDWVAPWCRDHLGAEPVGVLFESRSMSVVFGLALADERDVVVKARPDEGRAASCVAAQARLAERGCACARPLTPATGVGPLAVHAEESRPGGALLRGDSPDVAVRYAAVFARLMAELAEVRVAPPLPNPRWVRWDHTGPGPWPAIAELDDRDQGAVPEYVADTARRVRGRLLAADLPCVLGHADFEAQNLRWHDGRVWAVHDWDSLAWQPEAALAGAACGAFASASPPTLAPIESSAAFLAAYQDARRRRFTREEQEIAWAASLWPARTTPAGKPCTAIPRCPVTRFARRRPSACAGPTPSTPCAGLLCRPPAVTVPARSTTAAPPGRGRSETGATPPGAVRATPGAVDRDTVSEPGQAVDRPEGRYSLCCTRLVLPGRGAA